MANWRFVLRNKGFQVRRSRTTYHLAAPPESFPGELSSPVPSTFLEGFWYFLTPSSRAKRSDAKDLNPLQYKAKRKSSRLPPSEILHFVLDDGMENPLQECGGDRFRTAEPGKDSGGARPQSRGQG